MRFLLSLTIALAMICSMAYAVSFPSPVGYVNDFADVLTTSQSYDLESTMDSFEQSTSVEIAIITTNDLQNETIEMYSVEIFQQWGIGKKGQDNGLLIVLVPSTKQYRIEVGYGLEATLNDAKVGRIGRECFQTYFANDSYYEGFSCALQGITSEIANSQPYAPAETTDPMQTAIIIIVVIIIIILAIVTKGGIFRIVFFLIGIATGRGFGGGRSGGGGAGGKY
jgi:uncharacterized protein